MIRSTLAGVAMTAVAAATAVFVVGLVDPATGTTCYRDAAVSSHLSPPSSTAATSARSTTRFGDDDGEGSIDEPVQSRNPSGSTVRTGRVTPSPHERSTRSSAAELPTRTTAVVPTPTSPVDGTVASTVDAPETCVPTDELPETEGS